MQTLISIFKQRHGHFMQTDESWLTDMCRCQLNFDILIRLSLHWFVVLQGTGRFSKMTSTMLMWYSEICFEAWSAHLLPQTGHDLGMKSCMTGMHGLHNLFKYIRWNVVSALFGNALELGAVCCQPTSGPLTVPHFDVDVQRPSHCWSSSKHLGHYATKFLHISTFGQLEGRGQGCEPVGKSDATVRFLLHRIMNKAIWRALMCTFFLFSTVPFTGCLRAYRFYFTSLHLTSLRKGEKNSKPPTSFSFHIKASCQSHIGMARTRFICTVREKTRQGFPLFGSWRTAPPITSVASWYTWRKTKGSRLWR